MGGHIPGAGVGKFVAPLICRGVLFAAGARERAVVVLARAAQARADT
jgi:hypothetical protein